jgi:hypothetical protein
MGVANASSFQADSHTIVYSCTQKSTGGTVQAKNGVSPRWNANRFRVRKPASWQRTETPSSPVALPD